MTTHTVVVVDDLAEIRKILKLMLEYGGPFEVVGEGRNASEALALATELQPDLLVMDVKMPGGPSGWQALPAIRAAAPRTAVVIMSGSTAGAPASPGEGLASAVLEKGLSPTELNSALLEVLGVPGGAEAPEVDHGAGGPATTEALTSAVHRIERQRRALARSAEELEGFAYVAGHDLAQPLQVAYGYLEMLRSDYGSTLDPTAGAWLDSAVGALERMRRLVHDLLGFARAGTGDVAIGAVALDAAVDAALDALEHAAPAAALEVRRADLPVIYADLDDLVEVFTQLFDNAVKFAGVGTPAVATVSVAAREVGHEWVVTVADDGPGISPAVAPRAFDLFQRGRASASEGAGIGLALCRKLVERSGGRIWIDPPAPGSSGAVVRFSVPRDLSAHLT